MWRRNPRGAGIETGEAGVMRQNRRNRLFLSAKIRLEE
jgi:hypothetical protein